MKLKNLILTCLLFFSLVFSLGAVQEKGFSTEEYLSKALTFEELKNIDDAIVYYKKALASDSSLTWIYGKLGNLYIQKQLYDLALDYYRKAARFSTKDYHITRALHNLGLIYTVLMRDERATREQKREYFKEAESAFKQRLKYDYEKFEGYGDLGRLYELVGDLKTAKKYWTQALKLNPAYIDAYFHLNSIYEQEGTVTKSIQLMEEALKVFPKNIRVYGELGRLYDLVGRYDDAIKMYQKITQLVPGTDDAAIAFSNLAVLYKKQKIISEVIDKLHEKLAKNPEDRNLRMKLAESYERIGEIDSAVNEYRRVIKQNPSLPEPYYKIGIIAREQGDETTARRLFKTALKKKPEFSRGYYELGITEFRLGNFKAALSNFQKAIQYNPHHLDSYFMSGECYMNLKDYEQAYKMYSKALDIQPYYKKAKEKKLMAAALAADKFAKKKVWSKALFFSQIVYNQKPQDLDNAYIYGVALVNTGNHFKGIDILKTVRRERPNFKNINYYLALAYFNTGNLQEARTKAVYHIKLYPRDSLAKKLLGDIYFGLKAYGDAIDYYKQYLKKTKDAAVELKLAQCYERTNQVELSIKHYNTFIKQAGDSPALFFHIAKNLKQTDSDSALFFFIKGYKISSAPQIAEEIGTLYFEKGNYSKAKQYFLKAYNQLSIHALLKLTVIYDKEKDYDRALKTLTFILDKEPNFADAYVLRGKIFLKTGKYDASIRDLERAKNLVPTYSEIDTPLARAYFLNGIQKFEKQDYFSAVVSLRNAKHIFGDSFALIRTLGLALFNTGQKDEAYTYLKRAFEINKKDIKVVHALREIARIKNRKEFIAYSEALYELTESAEEKGQILKEVYAAYKTESDTRGIVKTLKRLVNIFKVAIEYPIQLADIMLKQGAVEDAEKFYRIAIKRKPDDIDAHKKLIVVLKVKNDIDHLIEEYEALAHLEPSNIDNFKELLKLYKLKSNKKKILWVTNALIRLGYENDNIYRLRGDIFLSLSDTQQAIGNYKKVLEFKADDYKILYKLANLLREKDLILSTIYLQNLMKIKPDYLDAVKILEENYVMLCRAYVEKKIEDIPDEIYKKQDFYNKFKIVGFEYMSKKQYDKAELAFNKFLFFVADPEVYYNLAIIYEEAGKEEQAYQMILKAAESSPTPALKKQLYNKKNQIVENAARKFLLNEKYVVPELIKTSPLFYKKLLKLGDEYFNSREYNVALKAYQYFEEFDTSDRAVKYKIAETYFYLKDYLKAYDYYKALVHTDYEKKKVSSRLNEIYEYYMGFVLKGQSFPKSILQDGEFYVFIKQRADSLYSQKKKEDAKILYSFYRVARPADADALFKLGEIYLKDKMYLKAYEFLAAALSKGYNKQQIMQKFDMLSEHLVNLELTADKEVPDTITQQSWYYNKYFKFGSLYYEKGEFDLALRSLLKFLKYKPKDYRANYIVGSIYLARAEYQQALEYLFKAYETKKTREVLTALEKTAEILAKKEVEGKVTLPELYRKQSWFFGKYRVYGDTYFITARYERAIPYLERYLSYERNDSEIYKLAYSYYMLKEYDKAAEQLKKILHTRKGKVLLGRIYFIYANAPDISREERIKYLTDAIKFVPDNWEYHYQLGRFYWELGEAKKALMHLEKSVKLEQNVDNLEALVYAYYDLRYFSEAKPLLEKLIALKPETVDYHELYAIVLEKLGNYKDAINEYENILRLQPEDYRSINKLSELYFNLQEYKSAIKYTNLALKFSPGSVALNERLALCLEKVGDLSQALKKYFELSQKYPENADYALKACRISYKLRDYENAVIYASKVLNLSPRHKEALQILAKSYFEMGDMPKAEAALLQYVNYYPDDLDYRILLARVYNRMAKYKKSRDVLEAIVKQQGPKGSAAEILADVYYNIAMNYLDSGEYKKALAEFEKLEKFKKRYPDLDYRVGVAYWNMGEHDKAVIYLERAKANYADDPFLHKYLGISYKFLGNKDAAITELREVLKYQAFDMETLKMLVDLYTEKDMLAEAVQIYKRMLKIQMTNAELYFKLGLTYEQLGDDQSALNYYEQAISFAPGYLEPYVRASNIYIKTKDYTQAKKLVENGLKINPKNEDLLYLLAQIYEREGNPDVLAIYKKITENAPESYKAHYYYAMALLKSQKYEEAIKEFNKAEKAIQIFDENKIFKVKFNRGVTYFKVKEYDLSEKDLKDAYEIHGDSEVVRQAYFNTLIENGKRYYSVSKYNEAKLRFERALVLYPDSVEAHYRLGQTFFALKKLEESLNEFKIVEEKDEKFESVHRYLGDIYMALNKPRLARKEYDLAISRGQDKELALQSLSMLDEQEGKLDSKIESYRKLLLLNPENPKYYFELAVALKLKGKLDEALLNFQKALDFDPALTEAYVNIGEIYFNKARYQNALSNLKKALEIEPYNDRALELVGDVYNVLNNLKEAITYWEKAVSLKSNAKRYKKIAKAYISLGRTDKGIENLRTVLELEPSDVESRKLLIKLYKKRKLLDLALDEERKLIDFIERGAGTSSELAEHYFNYGYMLYEKERYAEAINYLQKAKALNPGIADAYFYISKAYKELGDARSAIEYIEKAKGVDPGKAIYFYTAAHYYLEQNQLNKALLDLLRVRELEPNFININTEIAEVYEKLDDIDYAIKNYSLALERDSNKSYIYGKLGKLYLLKDKPSQALTYFKKLLEIDNTSENAAIARNSISQIYIASGLYDKAIEEAQKVLLMDASSKSKATAAYNIANAYYYLKNNTLAKDYCMRALRYLPDFASAQILLGRILLVQGNVDEAYTRARGVLNSEPNNTEALDLLADIYLKREMIKKALETQKMTVDLMPHSAYYWGKLANIYVQNGDYEAAENAYKKVIEYSSGKENKITAMLNLAYLYFITGNYDLQKQIVDKALELDPKNVKAKIYLAKYYQVRGILDKAKDIFEDVIKRAPSISEPYFELGRIYLAQNLSKSAIEYFKNAINIERKNPEYHFYLGKAYEVAQNLEKAKAEYKKATIYDVYYVDAYNAIGEVLMKQGKVEEAYSYFLKATQIEPNYARAHINLGQIYFSNSDYQKAIREFESAYNSAAKYSKDAIDALNGLGVIYDKLGNYDEAIKYLKTALNINNKSFVTHFNLGLVYKHAGLYEDAILHFKTAINLEPLMSAKAHNELGNIYYAQNRFQQAIQEFQEALKLEPEDYIIHTNLGFIYMQTGDLDNAIKHFKMALNINPAFIRAHINLGLAYYYKNMYEAARYEYNKALKLMPKQGKISDPLFLQLQELLTPLSSVEK